MAKAKALQAVVEIAGTLSPTLAKSIDEATDKLGGINWKAVAAGAAVGGIAIATGAAVVKSGQYLADLGSDFNEASNAIRIGTGATGEALDALVGDFDEIYKSVPTSMEAASTAVADFNTRLGVSGPILQDLSKQAIQVSDMLGDDLTGVIEGSSQAFQAWNIDADNMSEAMDYVFKVSQSTGMGFSDLMSKAQQFAPQLQDMGYSFEEATALMGQMEKAGVNTDEVLSAMKKSVGALAKEGISASDGLQEYYEKIKNAGDAAEATALASEIFGSKAGSTMASAIRNGTLAVSDLVSELSASQETIAGAADDTYTFSDRLQMFKQQAEVALKPLANTVFDSLNSLMPIVSKAMEMMAPVIQDVVEAAVPLVEEVFAALGPVLEDLLPVFKSIISQIMPVIIKLLKMILPPLMAIVSKLLPAFMTVLDAIMPILDLAITLLTPILDLFTALIGPIAELISGALSPLIAIIGTLLTMALQPLQLALGILSEVFTSVFGTIVDYVSGQLQRMTDIFKNVIDFVKNVFTGNWEGAWDNVKNIFSSIADGMAAAFKAPLNFIISAINGFIKGLNKVKIPDWVPLVGGKGFNISLIPTLATGGFTEGLSIAGEAGTEAVISFDPAYRQDNIEYWQQAGQFLGVYNQQTDNGQPVVASLEGLPMYAAGGFTEGITIAGEAGTEAVISFDPSYRQANVGYWEQAGRRLGVYQGTGYINDGAQTAATAAAALASLPRYESGGFTEGLSIAGEAGTEAVISFDPARRKENLGYWAAAGQLLGLDDFSLSEMAESSTIIIYDFSGFTWSPIIHAGESSDKEGLLAKLRAHEAEFFDWLEEWLRQREVGKFATCNVIY